MKTIQEIMDEMEQIRNNGIEYDQALALINLTLDLNRLYQLLGDICALAVKDYDMAVAQRKTNNSHEYLKAKMSAEKVTDKTADAMADQAIQPDREIEAKTHAYQEQVHNLRETASELVMSLKKKADIISSLANMGA
jgi:hypothetical protein